MQAPRFLDYVWLPLLYFAGAKFGIAYTVMPEGVVTLWLPNAVLLAALIRFRGNGYPAFAVLALAAEIAADVPTFSVIEATLFGLVNVAEASVAFLLLRRWHFDSRLVDDRDLTTFVLAGPVLAALMAAFGGASIYSYFRGTETTWFEFLRIWWFGDGLGLLICTPLLLHFWPYAGARGGLRVVLNWQDGVAAAVALGAILLLVLAQDGTVFGMHVGPVLIVPCTLYVAARFGLRWTSLAVALASLLVVVLVTRGYPLFGALPPRDAVVAVQELVFIISLMSFWLAALLTQLRAKQDEIGLVNLRLQRLNQDLEQRVSARTAELVALNERLERLAVTDPLTGTLNRRALGDLLEREMERCRRHGHPLAVLLLDIDHFKAINDHYGHAAGDAVLRRLVTALAPALRPSDALARPGGDEFVLVALETTRDEAWRLAERLRALLHDTNMPLGDTAMRISVSIGIAVLSDADQHQEELLRRADRALYSAKQAGRDRTVVE